MDTTCSAIVNETNLVLPTWNTDTLTNISEINYFDVLQRLILQISNVQIIDRFPAGLKKINIYGNPLNTIPELPLLLDTLIINSIAQSNNIQNLTFPSSLIHKPIHILWKRNSDNLTRLLIQKCQHISG